MADVPLQSPIRVDFADGLSFGRQPRSRRWEGKEGAREESREGKEGRAGEEGSEGCVEGAAVQRYSGTEQGGGQPRRTSGGVASLFPLR